MLNFLLKTVKELFKQAFFPKRVIQTVDKKQVLLVLTFFGPFSFEIWSRLQICFKNHIPYCYLKVVYQSKNRVATVFNLKDVVNTKLSSNIIYKFICSCYNAIYYGQTRRHLFMRASEHLGITTLTCRFVKTPKKSTIM